MACLDFSERFSEGVFDVDDLEVRTNELARFLENAANHYGFSNRELVAVGYSNGANIAASLLWVTPALGCGRHTLSSPASIHANLDPELQQSFNIPCDRPPRHNRAP